MKNVILCVASVIRINRDESSRIATSRTSAVLPKTNIVYYPGVEWTLTDEQHLLFCILFTFAQCHRAVSLNVGIQMAAIDSETKDRELKKALDSGCEKGRSGLQQSSISPL